MILCALIQPKSVLSLNLGARPSTKPPTRYKDEYGVTHIRTAEDPANLQPSRPPPHTPEPHISVSTNPAASPPLTDPGNRALSAATSFASLLSTLSSAPPPSSPESSDNIVKSSVSLAKRDLQLLDSRVSLTPQLSPLELSILTTTVVLATGSPLIFPPKVVSVLAPACAALSATVGVSAEYVGRVAVADGKETAAVTMMAAAEAEALLSQSERVKAILPLCVGVSATAASFALLVPVFLQYFPLPLQTVTEIYLFFPLLSVLCAAVAGLSTEESKNLGMKAVGVGNRR